MSFFKKQTPLYRSTGSNEDTPKEYDGSLHTSMHERRRVLDEMTL